MPRRSPPVRIKRIASDSAPQRRAEAEALSALGRKLRLRRLLANHVLEIGSVRVSLDGFYQGRRQIVLAEVNARIGRMKTATRNKVCKDALKMAFVRQMMAGRWHGRKVRALLVFLDDEARASFGPKSWGNAAFDALGIETPVCEMSGRHRRALLRAQRRQDLRNSF